jgi:hypothetical protein
MTHLLRVLRACAAARASGAAAPDVGKAYAAAMAELERIDAECRGPGGVLTGNGGPRTSHG